MPILGESTPKNVHWDSEQIVFVTANPKENSGQLDVYTLEDGEWVTILEKIPVRLGRNGLIFQENKREGDGNTPSGVFPIQRILGKQKREKIRNLEYTQIRKYHHWSDHPNSKNYNQLISKYEKGGVPLWDSYIYDLFIVIEHNTKPPAVPGFGSMIFLHVWNEDKPTSGCVGVSKEVLETLVSVLDGRKNPSFFIQIID
ncbi:L,D-transpeptidase family protein [Leptospira brenneri]|uniref:L,D-transpeptidase family protein n=1 Tax=Leptospira brenneri TaxID=2023182 RepID=UPI001FD04685|nr:L,D-transpeptidase family protein [Leptospira brenneri]